jgi:hypothetical protein
VDPEEPDEEAPRAEAGGDRPGPPASVDQGAGADVPEASSPPSPPSPPVDPWTWRWSNPEDTIRRLR